ncbi:MAG: V-type ATP synthase subunit A, partial [Thermoanaerobaculia bacterium]
MSEEAGALTEISGWVVHARVASPLSLREIVYVGSDGLLGEVVTLDRSNAIIQVYEETEGLAPGDPIYASGSPLSVELGPGLRGEVFDGVQRPLGALAARDGDFIRAGTRLPALDRERLWPFQPSVSLGAEVHAGTELG